MIGRLQLIFANDSAVEDGRTVVNMNLFRFKKPEIRCMSSASKHGCSIRQSYQFTLLSRYVPQTASLVPTVGRRNSISTRFAFRQQCSHSQTAVGDAGSGACTMWPPSRRSRRCQRRDVACRDWEVVAWRGWPQLGTIILYVFINYMFLIIFPVLLLLATCAAKFSLVCQEFWHEIPQLCWHRADPYGGRTKLVHCLADPGLSKCPARAASIGSKAVHPRSAIKSNGKQVP